MMLKTTLITAILTIPAIANVGSAEGLPRIAVGRDGWLTVDGKPFLAIGMYNAGPLDEMKAAGFNLTQSYNSTVGGWRPGSPTPDISQTRGFLDRTAENGMMAIIGCPREFVRNKDWQAVREWVRELKDHPAILCWEQEEAVARGFIMMDDLAELAKVYREEDPSRPFLCGDREKGMRPEDSAGMLPDDSMDIGIWWWYPFGGPDPFSDPPKGTPPGRLEPPLWLGQTESKKPLWVGLQAYKDVNKRGHRFPTPEEYQCMAYTSLIVGARGLIYFIGSGMAGPDGQGNGILNKPEEGNWAYLKSLVLEIRGLEPMLTAPEPELAVKMTPKPAAVCFTLRRHDGALYLIAANKDPRRSTVRFTIPGAISAEEITEGRAVKVNSGVLEDAFPAYGVRIYRVNG